MISITQFIIGLGVFFFAVFVALVVSVVLEQYYYRVNFSAPNDPWMQLKLIGIVFGGEVIIIGIVMLIVMLV